MWYKLVGRNFEHLSNTTDAVQAFENDDRRIALDWFSDEVYVSTVFLGLDHSFGHQNSPVLFESMVFGFDDEICSRGRTWIEAYYLHIVNSECAIHRLSKVQEAYRPYSLSSFVFDMEVVRESDIRSDKLIVDDGVDQPPISFGLFNSIFYRRVLKPGTRIYDVKWWELGDPACDIMGEVGPYLSYFPKRC
jgi:hypothetical protein